MLQFRMPSLKNITLGEKDLGQRNTFFSVYLNNICLIIHYHLKYCQGNLCLSETEETVQEGYYLIKNYHIKIKTRWSTISFCDQCPKARNEQKLNILKIIDLYFKYRTIFFRCKIKLIAFKIHITIMIATTPEAVRWSTSLDTEL